MIPYVETKIYNWFDIQAEICKRLGITKHEFYTLPNVKNEYRNLWHVFIKYVIPQRMSNDTYVDLYALYEDWFTDSDSPLPKWSIPALKVYNEIFYDIVGCTSEEDDCKSIVVKFSW